MIKSQMYSKEFSKFLTLMFLISEFFVYSLIWWRRIRGLWKLPDGRDWLWGKLCLVLMGSTMLSKSLIQFFVDGWGCVPSLSLTWWYKLWWGEGNGNQLQYSSLENPMDGGAWWAAVHRVMKSWTWLSTFTFTFHFHALEKEMATHSSVLAWRISGMVEPGLWDHTESDTTEAT